MLGGVGGVIGDGEKDDRTRKGFGWPEIGDRRR